MQKKLIKLLTLAGACMIIFVSAATLLAFKTRQVYGDIWQQLGISKEKGDQNIKESFLDGWFHFYGVRNIKNLMSGDRVAIAKDLMAYTKAQLNSEAFKKEYEQLRKSAKPVEYPVAVKTKEEIRKEKIAETEKSIREMEANFKTLKPDMVKQLQPVLDMLKTNLKDYNDPKSEMIDLFYQSEKMNGEQRVKSFQESIKNWEQNFPADYRLLIKARLQKFVELAKTVDFSAELKEVNGRKKFVNPTYEGKSYDWKQIYRAGKEVIQPTVAFAEQWIKEIN